MDPSPPPHPYSHLWNVNHAADIRMLRDQEREKAEQERERLEKLRGAEQAVDKHFEESLRPQRLAQHKQRSGWNMAPSFPPNTRIVEDPNRMRERFFPSHPSPVLHPHARFPVKPEPTPVQTAAPFKMFSYIPAGLPPAPLPDVKNSVIVKNEKKQQAPLYRPNNNNSLLIEAPTLQRPVYMNYTHPPAPKVVSPAPAHIYGKPSSKPPLSTSPYQQVPPHQPPPVSTKLPTPPPAHSGGATSNPYVPNPCDSQPLDLGLSLVKTLPLPPSPPKRKLEQNDPAVSPAKKPCPPMQEQQEPLSLSASPLPVEPLLSEPSSLTTSPVPTPTPTPLLLPSSVVVTNENSNSSTGSLPPGKAESSAGSSSSGAHKLKKAWLQRHSGVESTTPPPPVTPPPAAVSTPPPPSLPLPLPAIASNINGHGGSEDSSSSEEAELAKRVPPKVKRKKKSGSSTPNKKTSPSTTDSDKESDSKSDSGGKKTNGNNSPSKSNSSGGKSDAGGGNKKRRKKDSSENSPGPDGTEESKEEEKGQRDPCQKPPVSQLKKTGESWLQDGPCFEVAPKLSKCRECRWTPNQRSRNNSNIFCRFYAFRRLRYTKNGQLAIAGFSDPHKDAGPEDIKLWLPDPENPPKDIDLELGRFILLQLANQFCVLLHQEDEAMELNMAEDSTVAWKRVVQGVREMCDVCETTLFNFHWACSKCGFVVCIDCYRDRKTGCSKVWGDGAKDRDDASWLLCNNRQPHEQDKLMLTQIIAGNCLELLKEKIVEYKIANNLPLYFKPEKDKIKEKIKEESPETPLDWLADVALNKQNNASNSTPAGTGSSGGGAATESKADAVSVSGGGGGGFSKLRKLLIRRPNPAEEKSESGAESTSESSNTTTVKTEPGASSCEETVATASEASSNTNSTAPVPTNAQSSAESSSENNSSSNMTELKHFQRLKDYSWSSSPQLDIRVLTNAESKRLYPDVPHAWLCDGKLLRLTDPVSPGNYKIFQDMWRRGQPVLVSGVGSQLDPALWHPDSFAADFGDLRNDLINCATGNTVPNQSVRRFWEGFEYCGKRLKDDAGQGMLLKLKDWPPGDDFAEMLPTRFADLMRVLPLGEYTQRAGRLNLASRLPECFVKPDLGPKMYIAYGNYLYPSKATTNLHLDISDAVNLMVHVGIPKDGDHSEYMREAYRAIDEGGSDILTRRRVRVKGELPGALWHIFAPRDADKIRDMLNKVAIEKGAILERNHDSIHDQSWYLDTELRDRLYHDYKVQPYTIVQCLGDAVFVPAGAPHQVRNLHSCIKVAEDFVSPENVSHCFTLTQQFRELSDTHSNHEDKLQVKNIIFHAVKDSLSVVEASQLLLRAQGGSNGAGAAPPSEAAKPS